MRYVLIVLLVSMTVAGEPEKPDYGCAMYGCQCLDARLKMMTWPCPETNCYSKANCMRLPTGECGFEMTKKLKNCLKHPKCEYRGCGVCGVDDGIVPECANSNIWQCYSYGKCMSYGGQCRWLKTLKMRRCLRNTNPLDNAFA